MKAVGEDVKPANRTRPCLFYLLAALSVACGEGVTSSDHVVIAQVLGRISETSGGPVNGVLVRVNATDKQNPEWIYGRDSVRTDADGRFQMTLGAALLPPATTDVVVDILPSDGAELASKTLTGLTLDFSYPPAQDTLVIDAQLDPAP